MKKITDNLCATRRQFLLGTGAATAGVLISSVFPGSAQGSSRAIHTGYPRKKIGRLSALRTDTPIRFNYPDNGKHSGSILVKLGTRAGGGVGPKEDVVAFNQYCSHMGGILDGGTGYKPLDKAMGPCPFHLSTFDLTRHGMIIGGQATQSLPQVVLEVEGDDIYATGVIGLIYGRHDNLA